MQDSSLRRIARRALRLCLEAKSNLAESNAHAPSNVGRFADTVKG